MSEYEKQLEKQNGELQQMLAELQEKYEIRYFSNLERIASTCVQICQKKKSNISLKKF